MPHLTIEYSANVEQRTDVAALCGRLRDAMAATGVFPLGGVRVRAIRCDHVAIADGDPRNGFIHMTAKVGRGRDDATRRAAAEAIFAAAEAHLGALVERDFALSLELVELDAVASLRRNTIHDRLNAGT